MKKLVLSLALLLSVPAFVQANVVRDAMSAGLGLGQGLVVGTSVNLAALLLAQKVSAQTGEYVPLQNEGAAAAASGTVVALGSRCKKLGGLNQSVINGVTKLTGADKDIYATWEQRGRYVSAVVGHLIYQYGAQLAAQLVKAVRP